MVPFRKTDTDFQLEIKEDVYRDGEKVTYVHFHQKSGAMPMGSIFLRESGQMSFSADSYGKEEKPIFKESKTKLENCIVNSASLKTDIVKVTLSSFFSKENKK